LSAGDGSGGGVAEAAHHKDRVDEEVTPGHHLRGYTRAA
jgi:hypothetical protein